MNPSGIRTSVFGFPAVVDVPGLLCQKMFLSR